jgi:hypothetical protein
MRKQAKKKYIKNLWKNKYDIEKAIEKHLLSLG